MDEIEARWVLGLLPAEDLPSVAMMALESGVDTTPIRLLAGSQAGDEGNGPLFDRVLRSIDRGTMTKDEAVRVYTGATARKIVDGELRPYDGAKKIWAASLDVRDPEFHDVDPFIYAASEYEDRPKDREFFSKEIIKEARRWIDR